MRSIGIAIALLAVSLSCTKEPKYGREQQMQLPGPQEVWAVAPAVNLSGMTQVDPILQADLLFGQLQQVQGLTVVPVNRVAEVYSALGIQQVQSEEQAWLVCDLLGCQGLVVPTVTAYDAFEPPKMGAALQLFRRPAGYSRPVNVDPRKLARQAVATTNEAIPPAGNYVQVVGMFDAANGSTREALMAYAAGRNDPKGPYRAREYLVSMDRYSGFVYASLVSELLKTPPVGR